MTALRYLIKKQIKNYFISLKKNPAKLIGYAFILAFMIFMIAMSFIGKGDEHQKLRSLSELSSIIMGFFLFIFISSLYGSLERGATFFKMSDVNFLFTAPVSSKKILMYGIFKQMGVSLFVSLLMLYQAPALIQFYGITWSSVLVIILGYMVLLVETNLCCMAVYMFANGSASRKKLIKMILSGLIAGIGGVLVLKMLQGQGFGQSVITALEYVTFLPIVGWIKGVIDSVLTQNIAQGIVYSILSLLGVGAVLVFILKSSADYYEDVLTATEYLDQVRESVKEGKAVINQNSRLKGNKLKRFGLGRGKGASVIFFKQLLEDRRNGVSGLGILSLIEIAMALGGAFFLSRDKNTPPQQAFLMIIGFMTYMQMLTANASKWANELQYHHIYLIPQSGFKKIIFSALEGILRAGAEGLFMFVPSGFYLGVNLPLILLAVLLRMSFGAFVAALNLLSQRIFGIVANKGMMAILYFLAVALFELPSIIGGAIAAAIISQTVGAAAGDMIFLLVVIGWNIVFTLGVMLFANQLFSQMELNNRA